MIRVMANNAHHEVSLVADSLDGLELAQYEWCWVDFCQPSEQEVRVLENKFGFHHLAIEDCLHALQRPKMDHYEDTHFLVLHAICSEQAETEEINLFVRDKLYAAYVLIDKLVDEYFPRLYQISDMLDEIEGRETRDPLKNVMEDIFLIRTKLLRLRKTVLPMRDLLYRLLNTKKIRGLQEQRHYFSDVHGHLFRLSEMIESNRELTADLRDSYLSINSYRMNTIMKTLTVITTIFIPLTFIAGVYGMNFRHMPELSWAWGYYVIVSLMVIVGVSMFMWFRLKRWFD